MGKKASSPIDCTITVCDKCGQKYTTTRALRNHVLQVHEKARFPCQSCPMTFDTENKRRCHEKSVHSTDERFQCKMFYLFTHM